MIGFLHQTGGARSRRLAAPAAALAVCTVLAAVIAAVLATPGDALAHARLTRAEPADGAVLTAPPTSIELWFNERLDDEFNDVAVYRARDGAPADEKNLAAGAPLVDEADRTHLETPVGALAPGDYVVQWKVLSRDGHSARGRLRFKVAGQE